MKVNRNDVGAFDTNKICKIQYTVSTSEVFILLKLYNECLVGYLMCTERERECVCGLCVCVCLSVYVYVCV